MKNGIIEQIQLNENTPSIEYTANDDIVVGMLTLNNMKNSVAVNMLVTDENFEKDRILLFNKIVNENDNIVSFKGITLDEGRKIKVLISLPFEFEGIEKKSIEKVKAVRKNNEKTTVFFFSQDKLYYQPIHFPSSSLSDMELYFNQKVKDAWVMDFQGSEMITLLNKEGKVVFDFSKVYLSKLFDGLVLTDEILIPEIGESPLSEWQDTEHVSYYGNGKFTIIRPRRYVSGDTVQFWLEGQKFSVDDVHEPVLNVSELQTLFYIWNDNGGTISLYGMRYVHPNLSWERKVSAVAIIYYYNHRDYFQEFLLDYNLSKINVFGRHDSDGVGFTFDTDCVDGSIVGKWYYQSDSENHYNLYLFSVYGISVLEPYTGSVSNRIDYCRVKTTEVNVEHRHGNSSGHEYSYHKHYLNENTYLLEQTIDYPYETVPGTFFVSKDTKVDYPENGVSQPGRKMVIKDTESRFHVRYYSSNGSYEEGAKILIPDTWTVYSFYAASGEKNIWLIYKDNTDNKYKLAAFSEDNTKTLDLSNPYEQLVSVEIQNNVILLFLKREGSNYVDIVKTVYDPSTDTLTNVVIGELNNVKNLMYMKKTDSQKLFVVYETTEGVIKIAFYYFAVDSLVLLNEYSIASNTNNALFDIYEDKLLFIYEKEGKVYLRKGSYTTSTATFEMPEELEFFRGFSPVSFNALTENKIYVYCYKDDLVMGSVYEIKWGDTSERKGIVSSFWTKGTKCNFSVMTSDNDIHTRIFDKNAVSKIHHFNVLKEYKVNVLITGAKKGL